MIRFFLWCFLMAFPISTSPVPEVTVRYKAVEVTVPLADAKALLGFLKVISKEAESGKRADPERGMDAIVVVTTGKAPENRVKYIVHFTSPPEIEVVQAGTKDVVVLFPSRSQHRKVIKLAKELVEKSR